MKKYNRLLVCSVLLYVFIAVLAWYGISSITDKKEKYYKIEINRIYNSLSGEESLDKLSLDSYEYVKKVTWLPMPDGESTGQNTRREAGEEDSRWDTEIKAWYEDGILKGYLCFSYVSPGTEKTRIMLMTELILGVMGVWMLAVLLYLKYRLVRPFEQMSHIPLELAKGHMKLDIKEEKSKYFGEFLWGLGQLKESLEVSRRRELNLEKEKKKLLLSLSHDIKTPLNTITLYTKALEEKVYETEAESTHAIKQIKIKAAQIEQYVQDIVKTSKEDILDIEVKNSEFYLADLMGKILATYEEKCALRMLKLYVEPYENCLIKGDIDRAVEVLENLFENAFKYGDGRRIEITFCEEDYCHLIHIFNTGVTVTDNEINHIFESFFQGSNSEGTAGSGLGLYICREIMRKMGGDIFARRQRDGMVFVLVFR